VKPRILLFDDSPTARLAIALALQKRGCDVVPVRALDDLEAALSTRPDLLLLDVHLPEVFGDDLVPWLREERQVDRPILLCSARPAEELEQLAHACGADGWIRKNGRPDEVAELVARHLGGGA
jgi:DNA-binding response OmpR family regulator